MEEKDIPATHISHWISAGTQWQWESRQRLLAAVQAGYAPIIIDWYFGDAISPDLVQRKRSEYLRHVQEELVPLVRDVPGAMVILEPEFNKGGVQDWPGWDDVATEAINILKSATTASVGLAVGDWVKTETEGELDNIERAVAASDFLGFLLMSSKDYEGTYASPTNDFGARLDQIVNFLAERFNKPLFLAYTAISSDGDWSETQARYLDTMLSRAPLYEQNGLFGLGVLSLFDNPNHSGWFGDAERRFGLFDENGAAKPAAQVWRQRVAHLMRDDTRPPFLLERPETVLVNAGHSQSLVLQGRFSEWSRWQVSLVGVESGAEFRRAGVGHDFQLAWTGQSNWGEFRDEDVLMSVYAEDKAGNAYSHVETEALNLYVPGQWFEVQKIEFERFSRRFEPYAMKRIGFDQPIVAQELREGRSLELQLRYDEQPRGLFIGVENSERQRSRILLDGLVLPGRSGVWQTVNIPLRDLLRSNLVLNGDGDVLPTVVADRFSQFPWTALIFESSTQAASLDVRSVRLIQPAAS
ncbi:MAG: hypothetical protein AAF529_08435 [Pseudomonadota bacterium]